MLRNASSLVKVSLLKAVGTDLLGLCGNEEKKRSVSLDLKLQPQCFFFLSFVSKNQTQLASFADFNDPETSCRLSTNDFTLTNSAGKWSWTQHACFYVFFYRSTGLIQAS